MTSTTAICRATAFVAFIFLPCLTRAQGVTDPTVQQIVQRALDEIYGMHFAEADVQIRQLRTRHPQHPLGPILLATKIELQYLPVHENKTARAQFVEAVNEGIDLAKQMLDKDANNPEGVFFALTAHSYLAALYHNEGESLKAVGESRRCYGYLKDGMKLLDKNPDFYFTTGLYNYYVERYPMDHTIVKPFMVFFSDGDMDLGLKQMDVATRRGLFMRTVANYYLSHILVKYEMQPTRAIPYARYLAGKFPANPLFAMMDAEVLLLTGRYAEARPAVQRLKQLPNKLVPLAIATFTGILAEQADHDDKAAAEAYQIALKLPANKPYTEEYKAMTNAGLARIAARAGNRNLAKQYYKKVMDTAQYKSLIREAKTFR